MFCLPGGSAGVSSSVFREFFITRKSHCRCRPAYTNCNGFSRIRPPASPPVQSSDRRAGGRRRFPSATVRSAKFFTQKKKIKYILRYNESRTIIVALLIPVGKYRPRPAERVKLIPKPSSPAGLRRTCRSRTVPTMRAACIREFLHPKGFRPAQTKRLWVYGLFKIPTPPYRSFHVDTWQKTDFRWILFIR